MPKNKKEKDKFIYALDPSYTRTGICIINLSKKEIYFEAVGHKIGEKQFENIVHAAQSIVQQLKDVFAKYTDDYILIHEQPLPCSSMSPALYALDALIYNAFEPHIVQTYNPATLKSQIHGHKYDKKDSVNLATKYLEILFKSGYKILSVFGTNKKIPHDCCEAFLYIQLYLHTNGETDFQFDNSDEKQAYKDRMKELKRREKLLLSDKQNGD